MRDGAALIEAIEDMKPALKAGHLIMNHATVSKKATLQAAQLVEETGAAFLDAPFTGSKMAAQNGKLCYYIGGSDLLLERARPVLEASAAKILPLGAIGAWSSRSSPTSSPLSSSRPWPKLRTSPRLTASLERLHEALESNANYSTLIGMKLPAIIKSD